MKVLLVVLVLGPVLVPRAGAAESVTVIVSFADRQIDHEEPPAPITAAPQVPRLAARVTLGHGRDDGGTYANPITAALAYALAGHARVVASASLVHASGAGQPTTLVPLRLGIEGRAGAAGLELGGFASLHRACSGAPRAGGGGYAGARVYVPVSERHDFVLEAVVHYALEQPGCYRPTMETVANDAYGAYAGAGIEWQL